MRFLAESEWATAKSLLSFSSPRRQPASRGDRSIVSRARMSREVLVAARVIPVARLFKPCVPVLRDVGRYAGQISEERSEKAGKVRQRPRSTADTGYKPVLRKSSLRRHRWFNLFLQSHPPSPATTYWKADAA